MEEIIEDYDFEEKATRLRIFYGELKLLTLVSSVLLIQGKQLFHRILKIIKCASNNF